MNIKNNNNTEVINRILLLYLTDLTCFTEAEMEFFNKKKTVKRSLKHTANVQQNRQCVNTPIQQCVERIYLFVKPACLQKFPNVISSFGSRIA